MRCGESSINLIDAKAHRSCGSTLHRMNHKYNFIILIRPGQKALIASGFSETERVEKLQQLGAGQYLKKPYTLESLGSAVKAELYR